MAQVKIYARIEHGHVQEILRTDQAIEQMFHPSLVWVEVTGQPQVACLWTYDGARFAPPAAAGEVA